MLEGLMQHDFPLTLQHVLERMRTSTPTARSSACATASGVGRATARSASAPTGWPRARSLGVGPGDRVATFAWNTREHLEAYLAVPCMGAVLHTLNVRLFAEQLDLHRQPRRGPGGPRGRLLVPVLEKLAPTLRDRRALHRRSATATRLAARPAALRGAARRRRARLRYPELDERQAAGCATRAAPPATPRACSTRTARTCCTPSGSAWPTRSACAPTTA